MRNIDIDASREEIIRTLNYLISINNALINTLLNLSIDVKFDQIEQKMNALEKKSITQGDFIASTLSTIEETLNKFNEKIYERKRFIEGYRKGKVI